MVISSFYKNNTMEIYANDNLVDEFTVGPKSFTAIYILIYLERGTNFIKLHAVRECEKPSDMSELKNGDNRCLSFAIQNIALEGETKQYGPQENARQNSSPVVAFGSGFYMPENWSGILTRWMQANAIILVNSSEDSTANLNLQSLSFYRNRTLEISSDGAPAAQVAVPTSLINVSVPISLDKGVNTVRLHVTEGCERPSDKPELSNPDSRCLSVAVQNLTVT
jgi:hypothetical protein